MSATVNGPASHVEDGRIRIAVLDDFHRVYETSAGVARLRELAEVAVYTEPARSRQELLERLRDVPIVIANRERTHFTTDLIAALPQLELLCNTGGHAYHVDVEAATTAGVALVFAYSTDPATTGLSTAELTWGLILALMRGIPYSDRSIREGNWPLTLGHTLYGKTIGLLGLGRVGSQVARLATAFGMRILAWSANLTPERAAAAGAEYRPLEALLAESDIVSVHLSLSDRTRGLLNEARLRRMRPTAWFVNTSRGAIVDEAALVRVLADKAIAGAALDVFVQEPLPPGHPFTRLENVVLTAHLGWPTDLTYRTFADDCDCQIRKYLQGDYSGLENPPALQRRSARLRREFARHAT
jgi:phosphoglycerate dehydrogenase-like enzyme